MKLSTVVIGKNAAQRLLRLLGPLAALADELVILIDRTSFDESEAVARSFTEAVYEVGFDPEFSEIHLQVIERCTGDWILMIDDDDTESGLVPGSGSASHEPAAGYPLLAAAPLACRWRRAVSA